jgi:anti-anti-sigma factor
LEGQSHTDEIAAKPTSILWSREAEPRINGCDEAETCNCEDVTGRIEQADRPRVVLDCSRVLQFDIAGIQVLLHCLEEAMKRNGDVKLAAIPPGAGKILERTGVVNLFEVFDNTLDAVESFYRLPLNTLREVVRPEYSTAAPEKRNTAGFLSKRLLESGSRLTVAAVTPMMRWLSPNRGNLD